MSFDTTKFIDRYAENKVTCVCSTCKTSNVLNSLSGQIDLERIASFPCLTCNKPITVPVYLFGGQYEKQEELS